MAVTFPEHFIDFTHRERSAFLLETECPSLYWNARVYLTAETCLTFMILYDEIAAFEIWSKETFGRGSMTFITNEELIDDGY